MGVTLQAVATLHISVSMGQVPVVQGRSTSELQAFSSWESLEISSPFLVDKFVRDWAMPKRQTLCSTNKHKLALDTFSYSIEVLTPCLQRETGAQLLKCRNRTSIERSAMVIAKVGRVRLKLLPKEPPAVSYGVCTSYTQLLYRTLQKIDQWGGKGTLRHSWLPNIDGSVQLIQIWWKVLSGSTVAYIDRMHLNQTACAVFVEITYAHDMDSHNNWLQSKRLTVLQFPSY